jgi:hypothetical protein
MLSGRSASDLPRISSGHGGSESGRLLRVIMRSNRLAEDGLAIQLLGTIHAGMATKGMDINLKSATGLHVSKR